MAARRSSISSAALWAALAATACLAVACSTGSDRDAERNGSTEGRVTTSVIEVVDGDTIRVDLSGAETPVRLIGIDAPETDGPFTERECYGDESTSFARDTLHQREVELTFDVERTDRFDRTLAYVWVDGSLFNEVIVREGYAMAATFPPNVRYVDRLVAAEREARNDRRGLWGRCPIGEAVDGG
jgi:micrococcal nuclease